MTTSCPVDICGKPLFINFQMGLSMNNNALTIFYDGSCPLCSLEMDKLKRYDKDNLIALIDLHQEGFQTQYPNIDFDQAMRILHGQYKGKLLLGLDVTHRAWTLVGAGFWVAPLAFPVIKQVAHLCYLIMAKYRQPISHFLYKHLGIGKASCNQGTCYDRSNNTNHRR